MIVQASEVFRKTDISTTVSEWQSFSESSEESSSDNGIYVSGSGFDWSVQNVSHQQQSFWRPLSLGWSHLTNNNNKVVSIACAFTVQFPTQKVSAVHILCLDS